MAARANTSRGRPVSKGSTKHIAAAVLGCVCLISGICLVSGCTSCRGIPGIDCCADVPLGAIPEPAGTKVCNWQSVQVANAYADQSVLYRSDFIGDSSELSPAAIKRMSRLAHDGSASHLPWVIEPSENAALDQARLHSAIAQLAELCASPVDVSIGIPAALGLSGPQAEQLGVGIGQNRNVGTGFSNRGGIGRRDFGTFGAGSIIR